MLAYWRRSLIALAMCGLSLGSAVAEPPTEIEIRVAMLRVEKIMDELGVEVAGYATGAAPETEVATADHPYLQGNDGAYIAGRIYINEAALEACTDLTLIHELVHDATVKRRLFASVPNEKVREMVEALADAVTEKAAAEPYRPGCLPKRHFAVSTVELAALALSAPAP
ncbi:MAG: hypothetical protein KBA31_22455 [Alphaproteobacteria bacterium]|nr:hypothetical protein [Alphaproteobacteria bacterium]